MERKVKWEQAGELEFTGTAGWRQRFRLVGALGYKSNKACQWRLLHGDKDAGTPSCHCGTFRTKKEAKDHAESLVQE